MKFAWIKGFKVPARMGLGSQIWLLVLLPVVALLAVTQYTSHSFEKVYYASHGALDETFKQVQQAQLLSNVTRRAVFNMTDQIQGHHLQGQLLLLTEAGDVEVDDFLDRLEMTVHTVREAERQLVAFVSHLRLLEAIPSDEQGQAFFQQQGHFPEQLPGPIELWLKSHALLRDANNLVRYGQGYQEAAERTMDLLKNDIKERAVNNFLFEERARMRLLERGIERTLSLIRQLEGALQAHLNRRYERDVHIWAEKKSQQKVSIQWLVWGAGIVVLLCAAAFAIWRVTGPLVRLSQAMSQSAQGETSGALSSLKRRDEIGDMSRSLQVFIGVLKDNVRSNKALKQTLRDNYRLSRAIENNPTGLWLANEQGQILYLNASAQRYLHSLAQTLSARLPGFDPSQPLKQQLQDLLPLSEGQVAQLEDIGESEHFRFVCAERHFDVSLSLIADQQGRRIGYSCEWHERTQRVIIEGEIEQLIQAAAAGDLSTRIALEGKRGFYKQLSQGLNQFSGLSESALLETRRVLQTLESGDLTARMDGQYRGLFAELSHSINNMVARLQNIIDTIKRESSALTQGASVIAEHNENINDRTNAQAAALQQTTASVTMLSQSACGNAELASEAKRQADSALGSASQGAHVVQETIGAIDQIHHASEQVSQITSTINDIAFQTSLLSLNASVEAARAGEEGRGFAVVAGEVRNLAGRCSTSAKDIGALIGNSAEKIAEGQSLAQRSGSVFASIHEQVADIQRSLERISQNSMDQNHSVSQVNESMHEIERGTQQNSELVASVLERTRHLSAQAKRLDEQVTFFKA